MESKNNNSDIPSATCPFCSKITYNPNDIANQYCANCKCFYGDIIAHANIAKNAGPEAISALRKIVEAAHEHLKNLPTN
ncbi:MAG: hypothetical protein HWQ36_26110 [Nostoc sp. NMS2]|uniref:hypothetical protein n=1 Tax=Nostoc sp. NMS2 TaxID=2815389 RepID=UPI0025ED413A|nr:hypothetical protein [Nostoc sp. NMS2]MBN3993862.1 hypothetical protein [Nostoc sp. NMS2]